MTKGRLEAFSDGVIAIIITIMVLELKPPEHTTFEGIISVAPTLIMYALSFLYLAIYWNNHHHLLHSVRHVNGKVLWSNMVLLFFLSLVPFGTRWVGESKFASVPVFVYGILLLLPAIGYFALVQHLIEANGQDSELAQKIGRDVKGKISIVIYLLGVATSFLSVWVSLACYLAVALLWLVPDRRLEA